MVSVQKPHFVTDEQLEFLDNSSVSELLNAGNRLYGKFNLTTQKASDLLSYWIYLNEQNKSSCKKSS